jgi:hypothetical protein
MADMGLADAFNVALHVPALREAEVATVLKALDAFAPDEVRRRRVRPAARQALRRAARRAAPGPTSQTARTPPRMPGRACGLVGPPVSWTACGRAPVRPSAEACSCRYIVRAPVSTPTCGRGRAARRRARRARARLARHGSRHRREAAGRARAGGRGGGGPGGRAGAHQAAAAAAGPGAAGRARGRPHPARTLAPGLGGPVTQLGAARPCKQGAAQGRPHVRPAWRGRP